MVRATHVLLVASLIAAGVALVASARTVSGLSAASPSTEPTIVTTKELEALASPDEHPDALYEDTSVDGSASAATDSGGGALFTNNKIRIQDSRIVLTPRDRVQLIQSIARAIVADQKAAMATIARDMNASMSKTTATTGTPLVPLTRDAFLYLKPVGDKASDKSLVVRLGWRYPLATWHTYKAFLTTDSCEVKRTVGDFFYC